LRAVVVADGPSLELRDVPDPEPAAGEVSVRVDSCGICGSDLHMLPSGALPEGAIMGHEIAGEIAAVGPEVEGWSEGERVCLYPFAPLDHLDVAVAMGSGIGLGTNDGGYAELLTCPAEMLWRLPAEVELSHGALIEPLAVGLHGIDLSGASPEHGVCVLGCGPIGAMTLVGLRARGFERVVVVEPNEGRRRLADGLGASATFGLDGVHEAVLGELGVPPEIVLECAGHVSAPGLAIELIAPEGSVVLMGMLGEPVPISQLNVMLKEVRLRGSFAYRPANFDEAILMLAEGRVPAEQLISSRRPLADASACFDELLDPTTTELKILLEPARAA
jgi:(R,R)-butanediol dehydrogenase/meso-butanediol dehydrogenase/diacetyl reductase